MPEGDGLRESQQVRADMLQSLNSGDPAPAPYLGQHSEEVLAERLGLSSGAIGALVDAGTVALSDKDQ